MLKIQELAASRPKADQSIEQFLMNVADLEAQANRIGKFLEGQRVFFLGDDDHISPIVADRFDVKPVVYEVDQRVRDNLSVWFGKLGKIDYVVKKYDARNSVSIEYLCDSFYINPPYSSRSEGLGIKIWLMRAIEACKPGCRGILVMPRNGGNIQDVWVNDVQDSVDEFIAANGMKIINIDLNASGYKDTTQVGLKSSNVYLARVDSSKNAKVDIRGLYN